MRLKVKVRIKFKVMIRVKVKVRIRVKADNYTFVSISSVKRKVCIHIWLILFVKSDIEGFRFCSFVEDIFNPHKEFRSFSLSQRESYSI